MHQELLEATWQHILCLLVTTVTDVGHEHLPLEAPADPVVDTSGLAPVFLFGDKKWVICTFLGVTHILTSKVDNER